MDDDICGWVTEFFIRSPEVDDLLLKRVLSVIDTPDGDFRLKKALVLRAIENETVGNVVTENMIEFFEIIEELDRNEGHAIMDSLKTAYCAVALECTMKNFRVKDIDKDGEYYDSVKRIWSVRVAELERVGKSELLSRELKALKKDVEATLWDKNAWKKLVKVNTRHEAVERTDKYLSDARAALGPPFVDLAADFMATKKPFKRARKLATEATVGPESVATEVESLNNPINLTREATEGLESVATEVEILNGPAAGTTKLSTEPTKGQESVADVEILDNPRKLATETAEGQESVAMEVEVLDKSRELAAETAEGQESVAMEVEVLDKSRELAAETAVGQESDAMEIGVLGNPTSSRGIDNLKTTALPKCNSLASHRRGRGAKISHPVDLENDGSSEQYTCLDTPKVNRAREALDASTKELEAVVKDPLPNAPHIAETVACDLAQKNKSCEHSLEDQNVAGASNPAITMGAVPLSSVNAASATEKNKSIDDPSERNKANRFHLPSSQRNNISPQKKDVYTKFAQRRRRRNWSLVEEDTLRTAVQELGRGNWKLILNAHREIFEDRTEVDLKDKWRNMSR